jgi:putative alpha-1,2-mannosidase
MGRRTELTATARTGFHKYQFPATAEAKLMVDLSHVLQPNWGHRLLESEIKIVDEYTIEGYRLTSGWAAYDPIFQMQHLIFRSQSPNSNSMKI